MVGRAASWPRPCSGGARAPLWGQTPRRGTIWRCHGMLWVTRVRENGRKGLATQHEYAKMATGLATPEYAKMVSGLATPKVRHLRHQSTASRLLQVPCNRLAALGPIMANVSCVLSAVWASRVGQSRLPWLACCWCVVSCGPQSTHLRIRCLGSRVRLPNTASHTLCLGVVGERILCASTMRWCVGGLRPCAHSPLPRGGSDARGLLRAANPCRP